MVTGVSAGTVVITARESESGVSNAATVIVRPDDQPPPPSADGHIAFVSDRDGATELYVMNADGSDQRRLTTDRGRKDEIAISRDGRRIAFVSNRSGRWHVYTINIDGSGLRQVTDNGRNNWRPTFSPDGNTLVYFSSVSGGNDELYTINTDGSGETRLTTNTVMDVLPVYTPDGTTIVFGSNRTGSYQLFAMNADGTNQRQITGDAALKLYHDVSPDGTRIAVSYGGLFLTFPGGDGMYGYIAGGRIATMNFDNSDLRLLTSTGSDNDKPVYSPDGAKLAFSSNRDGQWEIYVMNSDGTGLTRLTNNRANDWFPAWGPVNP